MDLVGWHVFLRPGYLYKPTPPTPEKLLPVWGAKAPKPGGGLWTSPLDPQILSPFAYRVANAPEKYAQRWNQAKAKGNHPAPSFTAFLLHAKPGAAIKEIDQSQAWQALIESCPGAGGWVGTWPDWHSVAKLPIDGLHLGPAVVTELVHQCLEGWDVETHLWFRWCFDQVVPLGRINFALNHQGNFIPPTLPARLDALDLKSLVCNREL